MISEQTLTEIERIAKKHESVSELLEFYNEVTKSPYLETYQTLLCQIKDWNEQLKIKPHELKKRVIGKDSEGSVIEVDWMPGKIDLFGDKDTKEFDRSFKYFSEITTILDSLQSIRERLLPEEKESLDNKTIVTHKDLKKVAFGKTGT